MAAVHFGTPVSGLTRGELTAIIAEEITNWRQVGEDRPVTSIITPEKIPVLAGVFSMVSPGAVLPSLPSGSGRAGWLRTRRESACLRPRRPVPR